MKKLTKVIIIILLSLVIVVCCISLYVGNYVYEYTLNPYAKENVLELVDVNDEADQEARAWLDENSEDVSIESNDHLNLHAYSIHQDSDIYMIMVHGYRGDGASIISPIKRMKKENYNLLIPDLRGHGQSDGDYIGLGWDDREDILSWIDYILNINPDARIVLYGVSMGAATVMNVSGEQLPSNVRAIIEDCGYTSAWDVFKAHISLSPYESEIALMMADYATRLRAGYSIYDASPIKQIKKSQTPILFIHGSDDTFVPSKMMDELYDNATCDKEKLLVQGAHHADSCSTDSSLYYQTIQNFIERYI